VAAPASSPLILVVDDDDGLLILMAEALRSEGCEVATAGTAKSTRAWLEKHTPELMILDLKLPDGNGPALVADLQRGKAPVPFIVVTGQGDEKVAVEIMKQGALDYVMKDTSLLELLPTIVQRALSIVAQEKALALAQAEHKRLEHEILAAGERERHSIGADLHDGLGQQLTALELMCTVLKEDARGNSAMAKRLDTMGKLCVKRSSRPGCSPGGWCRLAAIPTHSKSASPNWPNGSIRLGAGGANSNAASQSCSPTLLWRVTSIVSPRKR
jgi:FixJ family two-component response regulator